MKLPPSLPLLLFPFVISFICASQVSTQDLITHTKNSTKQSLIQYFIDKATAMQLASSKEWKTLLHMDGKTSEIISPYFFLSQTHTAQDELEATIRAFYADADSTPVPDKIKLYRQKQIKEYEQKQIKLPTRSIDSKDYHALCRFPARFDFLNNALHFKDLPVLECAEYKAMRDYNAPKSASISFPTAHINSPASMFGHTFLVLDSVYNSRLLAFAINYQADANQETENGVAFALKGLFGFYTGSYSILPYYDKLKEYSNSENRDIWEYELNLQEEEIDRLYKHIWELSDAYSWYYFFNHNCSYNMLWLLEVARPSLSLRKDFIYQVNPPETLFSLQRAKLIKAIHYRPSQRTQLLSYEKVMSMSQVRLAKKLGKGRLSPAQLLESQQTQEEKNHILESALLFSQYSYMKNKLTHEEYTQIAHNLASTRSKLGSSAPPPIAQPSDVLSGSRSLRLTPLILLNKEGMHPALDFRITFHDITDLDRGYLSGAQIEFMRTLIYYDTGGLWNSRQNLFSTDTNSNHSYRALSFSRFNLYELHILSLASIAPVSKFFTPFSYRFESGFDRSFNDENLHYYVSLGGGMSIRFGEHTYAYYLLEPIFLLDSHKQADFALGQSLGIVWQDFRHIKLNAEYKPRFYTLRHTSHLIQGNININITQNTALFARIDYHGFIKSGELSQATTPLTWRSSTMLGLRMYF